MCVEGPASSREPQWHSDIVCSCPPILSVEGRYRLSIDNLLCVGEAEAAGKQGGSSAFATFASASGTGFGGLASGGAAAGNGFGGFGAAGVTGFGSLGNGSTFGALGKPLLSLHSPQL